MTEEPVRVWVDGCFDFVHFGHANALRQAKVFGDQLVVGVHSDKEIEQRKGPPVFEEQERYNLVRAIKWVDELVEDVPYVTTMEIMDKHRCQYCAHGDDIVTDEHGQDIYSKMKEQDRYKEFGRTEGVSTTDMINRIINAYRKSRSSELELNKLVSCSPYTSGKTKCFMDANMISLFTGTPRQRKTNDTVVYCPGTFDLFHIGHVEFLKKAAKLGQFLIVGLYNDNNSDVSPGQFRTVMRLEERMLSLLACRYVDNVIADVPYEISKDFLDSYKINLVVIGKVSRPGEDRLGRDPVSVPKELGIYRQIDSGSTVTTSEVIERIALNQVKFIERNQLKETREMARLNI